MFANSLFANASIKRKVRAPIVLLLLAAALLLAAPPPPPAAAGASSAPGLSPWSGPGSTSVFPKCWSAIALVRAM